MRKVQIILIIVAAVVYAVYSLFFSKTTMFKEVDPPVNMTKFREIRPVSPPQISTDSIFNCLIEKFKNGDSFAAAIKWLNLQSEVKECRKPADKAIIADAFVGEEPKFFIPGPAPSFEYTMMTLGVGHNIDAEKKILQKYQKCSNYVAVDPTSEFNEKLVTDVGGHFLEMTVGAKDDVSLANVLNVQGTAYRPLNKTKTSLQNVIKLAKMEKVDLLLIDIEGAEFDILDSFIEFPKNYSNICQFNIEIHSPWTNGVREANIIYTLSRLTRQKQYLLFNAETIQIGKEVFNRCFFINVKEPYCVKKYYPSIVE